MGNWIINFNRSLMLYEAWHSQNPRRVLTARYRPEIEQMIEDDNGIDCVREEPLPAVSMPSDY